MVQVSLYGGGAYAPHWHAVTVPLPAASDDSRDLVRAAVAGADHLFRPGTRYHKAGVTLLDILAPSSCQEDFFQPPPRPDGQALMHALDQINTRLGRGTVRLGRIPARPEWAMRQERRSPHYLCRWSDIPRALS